MDGFEFGYLPRNLIGVFENGNLCSNKYVGKFDEMNIGLVLYCAWLLGVKCFCVFSYDNDLF
jgi:hypothetical protein